MNGVPKKCKISTSDPIIKLEDNNCKVFFLNPGAQAYVKILFDGCVVKLGKSADFVLSKDGSAVVVECKGNAVEDGALQVHETAKWLRSAGFLGPICGLVVGRDSPGARSTLQVKKRRFQQAFELPLHVVQPETRLRFENVFRFSGHMSLK